jgi:predicted AAA+ superfamily ATPase
LSAAQWHARYPIAILDEVQKLPALIDTIKAVHDQYSETRYMLLGSSQILLLEKVRKSLAGRAALVELYPLTLPAKHHMLDPGIQKTLLNRQGDLTGHEFESAVIAEVYKQIKTHRITASCYHLRTLDGREVDILIELDAGYIAIEVKQANRVVPADARHLSHLREILDKPLLPAWLVSNDPKVHAWGISALCRWLGCWVHTHPDKITLKSSFA